MQEFTIAGTINYKLDAEFCNLMQFALKIPIWIDSP